MKWYDDDISSIASDAYRELEDFQDLVRNNQLVASELSGFERKISTPVERCYIKMQNALTDYELDRTRFNDFYGVLAKTSELLEQRKARSTAEYLTIYNNLLTLRDHYAVYITIPERMIDRLLSEVERSEKEDRIKEHQALIDIFTAHDAEELAKTYDAEFPTLVESQLRHQSSTKKQRQEEIRDNTPLKSHVVARLTIEGFAKFIEEERTKKSEIIR